MKVTPENMRVSIKKIKEIKLTAGNDILYRQQQKKN